MWKLWSKTSDNAVFCGSCGSRVNAAQNDAVSSQEPSAAISASISAAICSTSTNEKKPVMAITISVVAVVLVAVIFSVYY